MNRILECVPNFSEGRDIALIKKITDCIEMVENVKLLDVDSGRATNRTVVTFVGEPEAVVEAAFRAVKKAAELIDMSKHKGEHPRFGATDVLPLVPVAGISMEETVEYARNLGKRIGDELEIPVFCYENAAFKPERKNLASVRSGEYEGLAKKLLNPEWKPDFGAQTHNKRTGAIAVGARDFLIAYNINLNTSSTRRANAIAFDVREKGRVKREDNSLTGNIIKDKQGNPVYIPGTLKSVKAIGWYIKEYDIAQISMNLTNIAITPVHIAFDEVCKKAQDHGIRVTGSELIGLIPLNAILDAGRYFLKKQKRSIGVSDGELIKIAIKSLGLDDISPFNPREKIIEYKLQEDQGSRLSDFSLADFMHETASESPAPGGGSVSAYIGAMGVALGTMVANLSANKRGWDDRWEEFSDWAEKGKEIQEKLLYLVNEDTQAFNGIMEAYGMPKSNPVEIKQRDASILEATKYAIQVPLQIMKTAFRGFELAQAMAENGNPNSVSDAGVAVLAIRTAVLGAWLNVRINLNSLKDKVYINNVLDEGKRIVMETENQEKYIMTIVEQRIDSQKKKLFKNIL